MSKINEGTHNDPATCTLTCGHVVLFAPSPFPNDYVFCVKCCAGAFVLTITRETSLEPLLDTA